ncbi:MAG: hypothetical protein AVDCRST_MAG33-3449, partial [uncultured Thermomicrobiales bacterium]
GNSAAHCRRPGPVSIPGDPDPVGSDPTGGRPADARSRRSGRCLARHIRSCPAGTLRPRQRRCGDPGGPEKV